MRLYTVKFRVGNSNDSQSLNLHSPSESEAISVLKQRGTVPRDKEVIIYSITPV